MHSAELVLVFQTRYFLFVIPTGIFLHIPDDPEKESLKLRDLQTQCSMLKTHVS
jgi:hypothetical protein